MRRKKLSLNRETLRTLTQNHLTRAIGGGNTHEVMTGCACTDCCDTDACGSAGCGASAGCSGGDTCTCIIPASYCVC